MTPSLTLTSGTGARRTAALADFVTPEVQERVRVDANRWIKQLRLIRYGTHTMRERFAYRGDSLWWFTELYLHKMRRIDRALMTVLGLDAALAAESPASIACANFDVTMASAARAFGAARGLRVEIDGAVPAAPDVAMKSRLIGVTGRLTRWRPAAARPQRSPAVAAFVHTAFWRASSAFGQPGDEGYIGPVLRAVADRAGAGGLALVGVGPRRNFRARRWWDPVTRGTAPAALTPIERLAPLASIQGSLDLWSRRAALADAVTSGADVRAAATVAGCDLWDVVSRELREVALLQWPWSARAMDEAGAAFDVLQPSVALTYAEAGGWGRALMIEARRRGVRSVGVQHGFIYRHWLNYLHDADEMPAAGGLPGAPIPDRTLLFDRFAAEHLERAGHFPPASLVVTGNAGLDALSRRVASITAAERAETRRGAGGEADAPFVFLAAKFTEVRDLLPALVQAMAMMPSLRLAIKPHPAETPGVYMPFVHAAPNIRVLPVDTDLARLIASADAVVTLNSTVAIDAMALGVPALVIGLPSNLSPFVEAGVMAGAGADAQAIREGAERLLYDREIRRQLLGRAQTFLDRYGMRPAGDAAARAADAVMIP